MCEDGYHILISSTPLMMREMKAKKERPTLKQVSTVVLK
jgi:hypothetical protein